jgi:short-subunit dehydrogenase
MRIAGTTAVVTGASRGIGAATARELAARGAMVLLLARDAARLAQVRGEIARAGGQAEVYAGDLSHAGEVDRIFDGLAARGVRPEIVVNSAGAGRWLYTEETEPAEAVRMMGAPYFAAFFVTRRCLPAMLEAKRGHIVNINSPVAWGGWPSAAGYAAARYALYGWTKALRYDLRGTGVGVTSVVASQTRSDYWANNPGAWERRPRVAGVLRTVTVEEVAGAVVTGIERNRREVVLPFLLRVFFALNGLAPWVTEGLMAATGHKRGRA